MRPAAWGCCLLLTLSSSFAQPRPLGVMPLLPRARIPVIVSRSEPPPARSDVVRVADVAPARVAHAVTSTAGLCAGEGRPDSEGHFLARTDLREAYVDGTALRARVGRSAASALPAGWAPDDLVDLHTGAPATPAQCEPPGGQCLRRDAATALRAMLEAMDHAGHVGYVHSAFRAYDVQCGVFRKWAYDDGQGFCDATEQSALAGHSQHQLGTALDLFTRAWVERGGVFRAGFGCSPGGRWIAEHSWEYGFVLPYVLPPEFRSRTDACWPRSDLTVTVDPRSGYRHEPWHVRYLGRDDAARFHTAWLASGPGTANEITVDPWLRHEAGLAGDPDLPVCDGCACGACTTRANGDEPSACAGQSLRLDVHGRPVGSARAPELIEVRVSRRRGAAQLVNVEALVDLAPDTVTQPPTLDLAGPNYSAQSNYLGLVTVSRGVAHHYEDLPGAWRLVAEPAGVAPTTPWPYRVSLADPGATAAWNGANLYLPAPTGRRWVRMVIELPPEVHALRVALWQDGGAVIPIELDVPEPSTASPR